MAGFWSHRDIVDCVFSFDDLLDAHEMLEVKHENSQRAHDAARQRRDQP
ncbi:DUF6889 family protein [Paenibacillus foliorum]